MRGANLGCGRLVFPIQRGDPMAEHVQYALDAICPEAYDESVQWDNYDKRTGESQKERLRGTATLKSLDLFRYPWNIPDETYEIVWLSHIVEHIPHEPKLDSTFANNGNTLAEKMYFDEFDGWFIFFGECWRILKPGGKMHILAPYGPSIPGFADPTHTRYVLPGSFGYFATDEKAPFDYALPYSFQQIGSERKTTYGNGAIMKFVDRAYDIIAYLGALEKERSELPAGDRGDELRNKIGEQIKAGEKELHAYSIRHFNQISEFIYSFTPVK